MPKAVKTSEPTAPALTKATKAQLHFWIAEINKKEGKKVLNNLRRRIADHCSLDISLSALQVHCIEEQKKTTKDVPAAVSLEIQRHQWVSVRALSDEMHPCNFTALDRDSDVEPSIEVTILCLGGGRALVLDGRRGGEMLRGVVYIVRGSYTMTSEDVIASSWGEYLEKELSH